MKLWPRAAPILVVFKNSSLPRKRCAPRERRVKSTLILYNFWRQPRWTDHAVLCASIGSGISLRNTWFVLDAWESQRDQCVTFDSNVSLCDLLCTLFNETIPPSKIIYCQIERGQGCSQKRTKKLLLPAAFCPLLLSWASAADKCKHNS